MFAVKGQVLGKKLVNFTTDDGREIRGVRYYVAYERDGTEGYETCDCYVSENHPQIKLNDWATVVVDRKNKRSYFIF